MLTPNNIPSKPEPRRVDPEDDDTRQRIPDRPVDQLDDEKKKNKFKDALSKKFGEKKSTEFSLETTHTISGSHDTVSPFKLASSGTVAGRGKIVGEDMQQNALIAKADIKAETKTQTSAPRTPQAAPVTLQPTKTAVPQDATPRAAPYSPHAPHYVGTSPPSSPTGTPNAPASASTTKAARQEHIPTPQVGAPPTPQATPPAAPTVQPETTPYTAPTGQKPVAVAIDMDSTNLVAAVDDGFPEVTIGPKLPKIEEIVQPLNPTDPNVILALQTVVPLKVSAELTVQPVAEPAPLVPTQAARVIAVDLAEQLIRKLTTVTTGDRVETKIELRHPPIFEGVIMVVTEYKTATKEFNLAFYNLHNPDARALVESRANQQHLKADLIAKGYTLHNLVIEPKVETTATLTGDTTMERQRRGEGERDEDTGDLGGGGPSRQNYG